MKWYSARAPRRVTCQGTPRLAMTSFDAGGPALGERDHPVERGVGQDLAERRPDRRQRQRVAGQRPADPADVGILEPDAGRDPVGDVLGEAVRRGRDAAADRLADDEHVRVEAVGLVMPPGPAQIVWVSSMIRIVPVRRVISRTASW